MDNTTETSKIESDIGRFFDNYRRMLRKAHVDDNFSPHDSFEIDTAASMIVHYAESLLDYIEIRRRRVILAGESQSQDK